MRASSEQCGFWGPWIKTRSGFRSPNRAVTIFISIVYPDSLRGRKSVARSGRAEQRLARRANVLLLLDDGWSCEKVAEALYLDDDTLRGWRKTYDASGLLGLERFEGGGSSSRLDRTQEEALKAWIAARLPRSTRQVGVYNRTRIWRCL